jgi:hypothetical protein
MGRKVVIIYYSAWPGMGVKAVVSNEGRAEAAIELLMKHRRQANMDCPYRLDKFVLIHADLDQVEIAGRKWAVGDLRCVEVKDEATPEVPEVPRRG